MELTTAELALLVIAGFTGGSYAKGEGASSLLAAVFGVAVAVVIFLLTR